MLKLPRIVGFLNGLSPQSALDGLSDEQQQMCNVYAAAAQNSPIMVPDADHIQSVLQGDRNFFHLRGKFRADDIKATVEALDRKVIAHLVTQGGVQAKTDDSEPVDYARGTTARRVNEADGAERLKLIAYTGAARYSGDKLVLEAEDIAAFLKADKDFAGFFKDDDELNDYAEEVRALVVDDYAVHNPAITISFLLHSFPEPDAPDTEHGL